jgi:threonine dehydratase
MNKSSQNSSSVLTFGEIQEAKSRIDPAIDPSPCHRSESLSQRLGATIQLKLENLHRTGSFKERGARNRMLMISDEDKQKGVIASSAGNHAQAVAYHGTDLGIPTKIVMPENTPLIKVTRTRKFGADVVLHGSSYDEAYRKAKKLANKEGRIFVHPFADRAIMAGQGTIGLELLEQNPYLDTVIIPVGGGGLASGVSCALKETNPDIDVIGVETQAIPSMKTAFQEGEVIKVPKANTLADGIAVQEVSEPTYQTCKKYLDDIVTVSEGDIANAILLLLEDDKTIAEGAGAAGVAALVSGAIEVDEGAEVCPLICGGNIDVNVISRIIERGLVEAGRLCRLRVQLQDTPGQLSKILEVIAGKNINVIEIFHNRTFTEEAPVGMTNVELKLETRGAEDIDILQETLKKHGYKILDTN